MGRARDYVCTKCGFEAKAVCSEGDVGMSGVVVTPVVCPTHDIVWGDTGLKFSRVDLGRIRSCPCPECGADSPRWDRKTCPSCGAGAMVRDPFGIEMLWD